VKEKMDKNDLEVKYEDWRKGDIKYFNVSNEKISELGIEFSKNFNEKLSEVIDEYKKIL
jgi:hypothetical protein